MVSHFWGAGQSSSATHATQSLRTGSQNGRSGGHSAGVLHCTQTPVASGRPASTRCSCRPPRIEHRSFAPHRNRGSWGGKHLCLCTPEHSGTRPDRRRARARSHLLPGTPRKSHPRRRSASRRRSWCLPHIECTSTRLGRNREWQGGIGHRLRRTSAAAFSWDGPPIPTRSR